MNTIAIGISAALGVVVYSNVAAGESMGMRIGASVLAFVVTAAVTVGAMSLLRRKRG